jgi:hypothetical protein
MTEFDERELRMFAIEMAIKVYMLERYIPVGPSDDCVFRLAKKMTYFIKTGEYKKDE